MPLDSTVERLSQRLPAAEFAVGDRGEQGSDAQSFFQMRCDAITGKGTEVLSTARKCAQGAGPLGNCYRRALAPNVVQVVRLAPASVLFASLLFACSGKLEPCTGVTVGAKYELNVGSLVPQDGAPPDCATDWGFADGNVFTAQIVDTAGRDDCDSGVAEMSGNGAWSLALNNDGLSAGGALLEGDYTIARDSCSGSATLEVGCDASCLSAHTMPCACRLSVNAHGAGSCPVSCSVVVAASVSRL